MYLYLFIHHPNWIQLYEKSFLGSKAIRKGWKFTKDKPRVPPGHPRGDRRSEERVLGTCPRAIGNIIIRGRPRWSPCDPLWFVRNRTAQKRYSKHCMAINSDLMHLAKRSSQPPRRTKPLPLVAYPVTSRKQNRLYFSSWSNLRKNMHRE